MEKTLTEVKVIETDDGYRIELKGDKEHFKKMMGGPLGMSMGMHGHRHGRGRGYGSMGFGPMGYGPPPWMMAGFKHGCWGAEPHQGPEGPASGEPAGSGETPTEGEAGTE